MMDITRNQYFLAGVVLLLLGIQFRLVESAVLTPELTQYLAEQTDHPVAAVQTATQAVVPDAKPTARKTVIPPDYLGWMLGSIGVVLILHSWGMPKPG